MVMKMRIHFYLQLLLRRNFYTQKFLYLDRLVGIASSVVFECVCAVIL